MLKGSFRPDNIEELKKYKINKEIDKLESENRSFYRLRWRFWIGSVGVPLLAASATLIVVSKTGYFNAWQLKNDIAQYQFKQDTTNFKKSKDSIIKRNDALAYTSDSLSKAVRKSQVEKRTVDSINNLLKNNGLSESQKVRTLVEKVLSLTSSSDSLSYVANKYQASTQYNSNKIIDLYAELGKVKASLDSAIRDGKLWQMEASRSYSTTQQLEKEGSFIRNNYAGQLKAARDSLNACLNLSKR